LNYIGENMEFVSKYVAHKPDNHGYIQYSDEEHRVWQILYERQMELLPKRASTEYLQGLKSLELAADKIPQLPDLCETLQSLTSWRVEPVEALISAREFFELLADRHFPAATFIRSEEELDYVKEPDIFHEIFGHCPMLTHPVFADFVQEYAIKVLSFQEKDWPLLQRMFWFTVEFGLIKTAEGIRAYGGGILSSPKETVYSVESDIPLRVLFEPVPAFRTPYRIDMLQPVYFVIDDYKALYDFVLSDIGLLMEQARALGEYPPFFTVDKNNPNIHISAC